MLRYTKNGPSVRLCARLRAAPAHAALQRLLCSNTRPKTDTERATFYGFHGEIKLLESVPAEQVSEPPCALLLLPLVHIFYALCCKSSYENMDAIGTKMRMREVPALLLLMS